VQQKKPAPASPDPDSPTPVEPADDPDSLAVPSVLLAFEPGSPAGSDLKVFVAPLAGGAAGLGLGRTGRHGGAA
jgi:hypothetical protein